MKSTRLGFLFGAMLMGAMVPENMKPIFSNKHLFASGTRGNSSGPRRGKLKGYMKENKRCSFNKNR